MRWIEGSEGVILIVRRIVLMIVGMIIYKHTKECLWLLRVC